jgi:hypothetical protein
MQLAREARQQQAQPLAQQRQQAAVALMAAFDAVERQGPQGHLGQALHGVLQARQQWSDCVGQQARAMAWGKRRQWVHAGERPNPVLTGGIKGTPSQVSLHVPAMTCPDTGRVATGGQDLAQLVVDYWASISRESAVDGEATEEVMGAVQAAGLQLGRAEADAVGQQEVGEAEVRAALKHSAPGKAPGLDGLPVEFYRRYLDVCAPLLARVYTAMGRCGRVPYGFTTGVIVTFYKSGPRTKPSNYRPITLLNCDYRVLAKLLAGRLRQVQGAVISPEQAAFLPGRQIGENIMLLQVLPHALPSTSGALCVCLDFKKAYDTVSRAFLYRLLCTAGLGGSFLMWVQLLLQDTVACACVNGHVSGRVPFAAGVRQGCPLAPQLYLFVAQALLSYLKHKGFGVQVGDQLVTATQFADDAQVFLSGREQLPAFLQAMQVFGRASGQHLNHAKSRVLLFGPAARQQFWVDKHTSWVLEWMHQHRIHVSAAVPPLSPGKASQSSQDHRERARMLRVRRTARGHLYMGYQAPVQVQAGVRCLANRWQREHRQQALSKARLDTWVRQAVNAQLADDPCHMPEGEVVGGMPLVGSAKALGVTFMATGQAVADWEALVGQVAERYTRIARLPLSLFGRAFAASGYGLAKLLYAAEFAGAPPEPVMQRLQSITAKLVDRGLAPDAAGHHFAGVAAAALVGHPKHGGCGVMCLREHILARHAKWAVRLMTAPDSVQWVRVARHVLVPAQLHACPTWQHLILPACNAATPEQPHRQVHPVGMWHVPAPLRMLLTALQALPPWRDVGAGSLPPGDWCYNMPLWCNPYMVGAVHGALPWRGLEARFGWLALLGTINTVGDALHACHEVHAAPSAEVYRQRVRRFWFGGDAAYADWQLAKEHLAALVAAIPSVWRQVAERVSDARLLTAPTAAQVGAHLLGRLGWEAPGGKQYTMPAMTVRLFTAVQWQFASAAVSARHTAFVEAVQAMVGPGAQPVSQQELLRFLRGVWRLRWDNGRKEVVWRLVFDAFPTAARMHKDDCACACGEAVPGWQHHFWGCPVAQAVVAAMQHQLSVLAVQLQPVHLLLGRCPHPALHPGVWQVAVVAALLGMQKGMRVQAKWAIARAQGAVVPQHLVTSAQRVQVASQLAVATLWDMLQDFVCLRLYPHEWIIGVGVEQGVGPAHPFLATGLSAAGQQVLLVRRV